MRSQRFNPFDSETSTIDYSFRPSELENFTWLICREIGGSSETQKVPSWTGWLSQISTEKDSNTSTVEYMAPLSESVSKNSTVQYIIFWNNL